MSSGQVGEHLSRTAGILPMVVRDLNGVAHYFLTQGYGYTCRGFSGTSNNIYTAFLSRISVSLYTVHACMDQNDIATSNTNLCVPRFQYTTYSDYFVKEIRIDTGEIRPF